MVFGPDHLKEIRKENDLSQVELAELVSCTNGALRAWENGTEAPSEWWLSRLARVLRRKPDDLMRQDEDPRAVIPIPKEKARENGNSRRAKTQNTKASIA